jgi:hypothetical protein
VLVLARFSGRAGQHAGCEDEARDQYGRERRDRDGAMVRWCDAALRSWQLWFLSCLGLAQRDVIVATPAAPDRPFSFRWPELNGPISRLCHVAGGPFLQTDALNLRPSPVPGMRRTAYPTYLFGGIADLSTWC